MFKLSHTHLPHGELFSYHSMVTCPNVCYSIGKTSLERMIHMSGPALKQLQAHRAIHEGGLSGAVSKTELLIEFLQEGDMKSADRAADELIDYWKSRVISHADAEEEGL